jgi:DNA-binding response OmpR family regulator
MSPGSDGIAQCRNETSRPPVQSLDAPELIFVEKPQDPRPEENKSKVIVIVDDDPDTVSMVTKIGCSAGYTVMEAANGKECLSLLWRVGPQLLMLDVKMAGFFDGFEICRRVRLDPHVGQTPIAFLTARRTREDAELGIALGADDFIVKPFDAPNLVERIGYLVSQGQALVARRARRIAAARNRVHSH